jgi:hypothetical protein
MVGVTSLLAFFASALENKKAGCLNIERYFGNPAVSKEILKAFRPTLASG